MNTADIKKALQSLPARSKGCYAADRISCRVELPAALVLNTDPARKSGEHWVAVYINENGHCTFFDSYGGGPTSEYHRYRLRRLCKRISYSKSQLQSFDSQVCGEYCITFLHHMCRGHNLISCRHLFTRDTRRNDRVAAEFYRRMFRKKKSNRQSSRVDSFPHDFSSGSGFQRCLPRSALL